MKVFICFILIVFFGNASAQNVGIGTPDPQAKLHVETGFSGEAIRVSSEFAPYISFRLSASVAAASPLIGINNIIPFQPDFRMATPAGSNYPIKFYTNDNLRMHISETGNIGIGSSGTPAVPLHINSTVSESFRIQGPTAYQTFYNNNDYKGYVQAWTDALGFGSTPGNALRFYTNGGTERMAILPNGSIGINNAAPAYSLDVAGDVNLSGALRTNGTAGTPGQVLISAGNANPQWSNAAFSNQVRFAADFSQLNATPMQYTQRDNFSPTDVSITSTSITINKSGLYHIEGPSRIFIEFSSPPASLTANKSLFAGLINYEFETREPLNPGSGTPRYEKTTFHAADIYIPAGTTISFFHSLSITGGISIVTRGFTGTISGYLISE